MNRRGSFGRLGLLSYSDVGGGEGGGVEGMGLRTDGNSGVMEFDRE